MADDALAAAYRAIRQQASANPDELWGSGIYADFAKSGGAKPYLVFMWMGGGEIHLTQNQDASFVIGIKIVSENLAQAFQGAARIEALFNDQGVQDGGSLDGGTYWEVSTITKGLQIHLVEQVSGSTQLYHEGHQYRFLLQRK